MNHSTEISKHPPVAFESSDRALFINNSPHSFEKQNLHLFPLEEQLNISRSGFQKIYSEDLTQTSEGATSIGLSMLARRAREETRSSSGSGQRLQKLGLGEEVSEEESKKGNKAKA